MEHHAALSWQEVPFFMTEIATRVSIATRAVEFAILTATRAGEVRGATWPEIDIAEAVWTIPPNE